MRTLNSPARHPSISLILDGSQIVHSQQCRSPNWERLLTRTMASHQLAFHASPSPDMISFTPEKDEQSSLYPPTAPPKFSPTYWPPYPSVRQTLCNLQREGLCRANRPITFLPDYCRRSGLRSPRRVRALALASTRSHPPERHQY